MFFKNYRLLLLTLVALMLSACGSTPKKVTTQVPQQIAKEITVDTKYDADYYLKNGQRAYQRSGDIRVRNQWILRAAEAFTLQDNCVSARKVVHLTLPELTDSVQQTHANVLLAECLLKDGTPDDDQLVQLIDTMRYQTGFDNRINRIKSVSYARQERWLDAAQSALRGSVDGQLNTQTIWQYIQNLEPDEVVRAKSSYPYLSPWLDLTALLHRYGFEQQQFNQAIKVWQSTYANHPLSQSLPAEVQLVRTLPLRRYNKIAVLLPLSGRLASQGQAIKDGLMAAYFDNAEIQLDAENPQSLTFFDTNRSTPEELAQQTETFDFIIGPLLKDNIRELTLHLPQEKAFLALNRIEGDSQAEVTSRYYFALAPEDEALQLVAKVKASGVVNPILVVDDSSTTRRMAESFLQTWQADKSDGTPAPSMAVFSNNKNMRTGVTQLLDVEQSNQRIKQIENLISKELHAVPRNRRDIDAIIIFANPEQTELLNPIIESSLSPFNNRVVPVFATSRSYSLELNNNSLRDLRNLTFTDMPWMLPEHQWRQLDKQLTTLWPDRTDTLRRLFAMGYDSYTMLPKLPYLAALPQLKMSGLTGELHLDTDNQIRRVLPFGKVVEGGVELIEMD